MGSFLISVVPNLWERFFVLLLIFIYFAMDVVCLVMTILDVVLYCHFTVIID